MIEHPASGLRPENRSALRGEFWRPLQLKIRDSLRRDLVDSSILRII
jgi:hypothetical protein